MPQGNLDGSGDCIVSDWAWSVSKHSIIDIPSLMRHPGAAPGSLRGHSGVALRVRVCVLSIIFIPLHAVLMASPLGSLLGSLQETTGSYITQE